jgi:hypothetical protein
MCPLIVALLSFNGSYNICQNKWRAFRVVLRGAVSCVIQGCGIGDDLSVSAVKGVVIMLHPLPAFMPVLFAEFKSCF